jgi:glucans biosynthesis protein C
MILKRDIAIDYLRSSVTVAVVAHHSALAYNTFSHYYPSDYITSTTPVVDAVRWAPLDALVGWNDLFFMSLMFLISGLFVSSSIKRKGVGHFLTDRTKRLGIPFVISAAVLGPLAYYPSFLLSDFADRGHFLTGYFTTHGWSPGPAWFLWLLLAFSVVVAVFYRFIPNLMRKLSWSATSAHSIVGVFLVLTMMATLPLELLLSPSNWFTVCGPLRLQTSRLLLYFVWFLLGVGLGNGDMEHSLSRENLKRWPLWLGLGALGYVAHGLLLPGTYLANTPAWVIKVILATASSFCCTFTGLALLGLARTLFRNDWPAADNLSENAYGIYVFHYGFVTWLQFCLLTQPLPAPVKFLITFSAALAGSWLLTALLRKTVAGRVL